MDTKAGATAQGSPRLGASGYEKRDASVPWIFGLVAFLLCGGIVIHLALGGALGYLRSRPAPTDAWQPVPRKAQAAPKSFPQLQVSPRLDLGAFRAREDEVLTNYGWIDRTSGIVRVPIERAIELVLQRGLPVRTNLASRTGASPEQLIQERVTHRQREVQGQQ